MRRHTTRRYRARTPLTPITDQRYGRTSSGQRHMLAATSVCGTWQYDRTGQPETPWTVTHTGTGAAVRFGTIRTARAWTATPTAAAKMKTQTAAALPVHPVYRNTPIGPDPVAYAPGGVVGSPGIPMFTYAAEPADVAYNPFDEVEATVTGVVCGECSEIWQMTVRHVSAAHIRTCHQARQDMLAEEAAEWPLVRAGIL